MKNNKNETIEKSLSKAAEQMIPDNMYERIMQNIDLAERTMEMENVISANSAGKSTVAQKKKQFTRWASMAAAACIILVCGIFGGQYYLNNVKVDSIVNIDVNPGIEIITNRNDVVLEVNPVNKDAEKVLDGMDLKKTNLKVAVNAIIGSMVKNGYLLDSNNSILVSVQNDDSTRAEHIRKVILEDIDLSLKGTNVKASVANQTISKAPDVEKFALENGISKGKATLILNLCGKDSSLKAEELAKMSLKSIAATVSDRNIDISDIVDYDSDDSIWENVEESVEEIDERDREDRHVDNDGTAANTISISKVKEIVLSHAGVKAQDATFEDLNLDREDGLLIYEVEFRAGNTEYDYEVDAVTGKIISYSKETDDDESRGSTGGTGNASTSYIGLEKAKSIALAHAGVSAANARELVAELDKDNGKAVYEVEFRAGNTEYDYEIDAVTGKIISYSKETDDDESRGSTGGTGNASTSYIGFEKAKSIALAHAGVSASNARELVAELDKDNGKAVYEVEFRAGNTEYDYEIDAVTGKIISYSKETDDDESRGSTGGTGNASTSYIGLEKAKSIALAHAGVSAANARELVAELDKDNGKAVYEVEFRAGNTEYDYEIDAVTGKIISYSKETDDDESRGSTGGTGNASTSYISLEKAKSIALAHAGVSAANARELETELDKDNGKAVYEVEFESGNKKYSYEIDAVTGNIIDYETEIDD